MTLRIGPAGWSYKDWDGIVYPAPKPRGFDPLAYLAGYFDTVEVNSTFYRPCAPAAAQGWAFGRDGAGYPLVLEVRHASWNVPAFYGALAERGIGFVNVDQPLFAKSLGPSATATAPVGYVRLHGRNYADWFRPDAGVEARYDYLYSAEELGPWAERTKAVAAAAPETYAVTNNHYRGQAITNAVMLGAMVAGRPAAAPPGVLAEYGEALAPYAAG